MRTTEMSNSLILILTTKGQGSHSVLFVETPKILVRERSWERSQERSRTEQEHSSVDILCFFREWSEIVFLFGSVRENVRKNATEPNKNIRQSILVASFGSDRRSYEQNYVTPCIVRLRLHSGILIFQRRRFSKCEKKFSWKIANVRWNILKCDDRKILLEQGGKIKYFPTSNDFRKN